MDVINLITKKKKKNPSERPPVLPTGRTKSLAWGSLVSGLGVPSGLVGLVGLLGCALGLIIV
jgi:hypothetical protein